MKLKIYLASSWRNPHQQNIVMFLRELGCDVYDFKNPPQKSDFRWKEAHPDPLPWSVSQYREALKNPLSGQGFNADYQAIVESDVVIRLMPAGDDSAIEWGMAIGLRKECAIWYPEGYQIENPSLMALCAQRRQEQSPILEGLDQLKKYIDQVNEKQRKISFICRDALGINGE